MDVLRIEQAARNLVALKDLKEKIEARTATNEEECKYYNGKDDAWKELRAALGVYGHSLPSSLEHQHYGDHYKGRAIQPVEYNHANKLSFNLGSVVKYVTRHLVKDGVKDLKKAVHFLQFELEQVYGVRTKVEYSEPKR